MAKTEDNGGEISQLALIDQSLWKKIDVRHV
jgi:hypothetical protein